MVVTHHHIISTNSGSRHSIQVAAVAVALPGVEKYLGTFYPKRLEKMEGK